MRLTAAPAESTQVGDGHAYRMKRRITVIGAAVNVVLAAGKMLFGVIGQSQALIVDGIHSLSDLISDGVVLAAARAGSKEADADHPYGHARIETAATIVIGLLLLAVAGGFVYDAALRLLEPDQLWHPGWPALAVAAVSVLTKEALYHYTARAGRRVRSRLVQANAWHHRSDALSSVVVVVGVAGSMLGLVWFDAVATIVVAAMVAVVGWGFSWSGVRELVDTGVEPEALAEMEELIRTVGGVIGHHGLRTRRMGANVLVDVHVLVEPWLSVSEGHRIAEEVRARLVERTEDVTDVLVHVDHEPDPQWPEAVSAPPLRPVVLAELSEAWAGIAEAAEPRRVVLHYRGGRVDVEVLLAPGRVEPSSLTQLANTLRSAAVGLGYIGTVRVMIG